MIRQLKLALEGVVVATVAVGMTVAGVGAGSASAASGCADYHWIGAAGSGQRDAANMAANGGMGDVVYQSYQQLQVNLAAEGRTITAEAVDYPAAPVPADGGIGDWMNFMGSVKDGTRAAADQFAAYTAKCPTTKVILAGYSQGAMVIHRNLHDLADDPHVAAALLIADGDRLPADTTVNMGSTAAVPKSGMGVAQDHSFLASAPTSKLPPEMGARTISVCDVGDAVCDYDPDKPDLTAAGIAIHRAYSETQSGMHAWGGPLYGLVMSASPSPTYPVEALAQSVG